MTVSRLSLKELFLTRVKLTPPALKAFLHKTKNLENGITINKKKKREGCAGDVAT
jgi:hypothetical protein